MSINRVVLVGRLVRDPELRTTTTGKSVTSFTIAVTKRFKPQDGGQDADFFRVTAWEKTAEFVANYLTKGRLIAIDGRIQSRKYTTKEGVEREVVEVVAESVQSLDRPRDDDGNRGGAAPSSDPEPVAVGASEDEYDPFADD